MDSDPVSRFGVHLDSVRNELRKALDELAQASNDSERLNQILSDNEVFEIKRRLALILFEAQALYKEFDEFYGKLEVELVAKIHSAEG